MGHSKITKDHPHFSEYEEMRKNFKEKLEDRIETWGDFEKSLKDNLEAYFALPGEDSAAATVSLFYAALTVLIENPEEGDIKKIVAKIGDLLIYRPDITGSDVREIMASVSAKMLKSLIGLGEALSKIVESADSESVKTEEEQPEPGDKPILH
jgi:predicted PP-loop superfamily ATPase